MDVKSLGCAACEAVFDSETLLQPANSIYPSLEKVLLSQEIRRGLPPSLKYYLGLHKMKLRETPSSLSPVRPLRNEPDRRHMYST